MQQPRELGVAVWHVHAARARGVVPQRADHIAQREQALVDGDCLREPHAHRAGALVALAAREVHEVELGARHARRRAIARHAALLHDHGEDRVAAGTALVHARGARRAADGARLERLEELPRGPHRALRDARDHDPAAGVLADREAPRLRREQVPQLLTARRGAPHASHPRQSHARRDTPVYL